MKKKESIIILVALVIVGTSILVYPRVQTISTAAKSTNNQIETKPVVIQTSTAKVDQDYLEKAPTHPNNTPKPVVKKNDPVKPTDTKSNSNTVIAPENNRIATGAGKSLTFKVGDTVCGYTIKINGKTYIDKVIKDSPMDGTITDGVIWPWAQETTNMSVLNNDDITAIVIESTPQPIAPKNSRIETGTGKSLTFKVGDTVCGYQLTFDNGKIYKSGIIIKSSPYAGTVTDGVIWPTDSEFSNLKLINPKVDQPDNTSRLVSGTNGTICFSKGDTVVGKIILINGKTFYDALIIDAPYFGYATDGIVWPTATERLSYNPIDPVNDPSQPHQRIITTSNGTIYFKKGDSVWGKQIVIGDKLYQNTHIVNANADGSVTSGIVWPNYNDIPQDAIRVVFP